MISIGIDKPNGGDLIDMSLSKGCITISWSDCTATDYTARYSRLSRGSGNITRAPTGSLWGSKIENIDSLKRASVFTVGYRTSSHRIQWHQRYLVWISIHHHCSTGSRASTSIHILNSTMPWTLRKLFWELPRKISHNRWDWCLWVCRLSSLTDHL